MNTIGISILILLLSAATVVDLKHHRIPNLVSFGGVLLALALHSVGGNAEGILFAITGMAAGFGVFVIPYSLRVMGAGDVKLMMMVGAFLGWSHTLDAALYTLAAGFLMGVIMLARAGQLLGTIDRYGTMLVAMAARTPQYIAPVGGDAAGKRFPYAAAISLGTLAQIFQAAGV